MMILERMDIREIGRISIDRGVEATCHHIK